MDLDVPALRWAKAENLERLLRALRVPLPDRGVDAGLYHRRLVRATWLAMDHDRRQAAAEEQRMKDEEARRKVAAEIAAALGETGERPRAQIRRIVKLMGVEWAQNVAQEASTERSQPVGPRTHRMDGGERTLGGIFFALARHYGSAAVVNGTITRREFFRCFTDRPKAEKTPVPPPTKWEQSPMDLGPNGIVEAPPDPYHVQHRTRGGKGAVGRLRGKRKPAAPVVEYVASRRRSG